jgi:hypothetical protein
MIQIPIEEGWEEEARFVQNMILDSLAEQKKLLSYTKLAEKDAYKTGHLGELALRRFFDNHGVEYHWDFQFNGCGQDDRVDFYCHDHYGKAINLDIKTAGKAHYQELMTPSSNYYMPSKVTHYVGAKIVRKAVQLWGFIPKHDITEERMVKVMSRCKKLRDLWEIKTLALNLRKQRDAA